MGADLCGDHLFRAPPGVVMALQRCGFKSGFFRNLTDRLGRVGSGRVRSGPVGSGRVGSGRCRVGLGRVVVVSGRCRVGSGRGRVGSSQEFSNSHGSVRANLTRPDPTRPDLTREVRPDL